MGMAGDAVNRGGAMASIRSPSYRLLRVRRTAELTAMFDYLKWGAWFEAKSNELRAENFETAFRHGANRGAKPGMILEIAGRRAMASFECWVTGETDYTVLVPPNREARTVAHRWGLRVANETFE